MEQKLTQPPFLPTSREEMARIGWDGIDVVLITGDAYVDHPSFGVSLIGRYLVDQGFRVAVLPQPRHDSTADFTNLPRPRLFCGITGGNLDSVVANYSGNGRVRDHDAYSPGGDPWFPGPRVKKNRRRPDRASIVYSSLARAAWPGVLLVLGGIEASLRRFIHYDFKQERLRSSILSDAKADILVYGMGELQVAEIARRLDSGRDLHNIAGTCERISSAKIPPEAVSLPGWAEINNDPARFMEAEKVIEKAARSGEETVLAQEQKSGAIIQYPAARPLSTAELDHLYSLPFSRRPHPEAGDVPAWRMVRDSVTIVRGCVGNCTFCAISRHQGNHIISRSPESVIREVKEIASAADFHGTISDLGGPTANLYATSCAIGGCKRRDCLMPKVCPHLVINEEAMLDLLRRCRRIKGVKHLLVSSGLRMELLLKTPRLLREIIRHHTPGRIKIAPEHTEAGILTLMHKAPFAVLKEFIGVARKAGKKNGVTVRFSPYVISAHPGADEKDARAMAAKLKKLGLVPEKPQDFTPTPGSLATAMYHSGRSPEGKKIFVARGREERRRQRESLEALLPRTQKERKKKISCRERRSRR